MIYICADDYGLCDISSKRITRCVNDGALNKVSVFPNFDTTGLDELCSSKNVEISLHINLVEGKCISQAKNINLLANEDGSFKHSFGGLFLHSIFNKRKFEAQVYEEVKSQVLLWRDNFSVKTELLIDSHQHTHMIPGVFKAIVRVIKEEKINVKYLRIPAEPVLPYIKTPSLYFTYNPINIIKQWLLKFLWVVNKRHLGGYKIPTAYFFGILFSGRMDEKRVKKILPHYLKIATKENKDIEILFHPGYLEKNEVEFSDSICFNKFYLSKNRKTEFDTVMSQEMKVICDK